MTHGWAVLALLVILGMLLYLGLFSPKTPEVCIIQTGASCNSARLSVDGYLVFSFGNMMQKKLLINAITCTDDPSMNISNTGTASNELEVLPAPIAVSMGAAMPVSTQCKTPGGVVNGSVGGEFKGKLYIRYSYDGENANRFLFGDISAKLQPNDVVYSVN